MQVYFDESGDLGWTLNKPYGDGGSSRYLTIAFLFVDESLKSIPKRIIKDLYRKRKQSSAIELKGCRLKQEEKEEFINKIKRMLKKYRSIKLAAKHHIINICYF